MTLQDLGNLGELIAAIATVATLFYLALQIRRSTHALRGTSHEGSVNRHQAWSLAIASDAELSSITMRFSRGEELTDLEMFRLWYLWSYVFVGTEAAYLQYHRGNLERDLWEAQLLRVRPLLSNHDFLEWWRHQRAGKYTERFEQLIEREIREVTAASDDDAAEQGIAAEARSVSRPT